MDSLQWLGVTNAQALRFFFERLKDVSEDDEAPAGELLYNASLLAHFATTSTSSTETFPPCPVNLRMIFDLYVMDRSRHVDPEIMEGAGAQCLILTGFFQDQQKARHNINWYASLGAAFFNQAAHLGADRERSRMMEAMAARFGFWRRQQRRLAIELRDLPRLLFRPPQSG
jgi:hypothetical protein